MLNEFGNNMTLRISLIAMCILLTFTTAVIASETTSMPKIAALINGAPIYSAELGSVPESRIRQYSQMGSKLSKDELQKLFRLKELDDLIGRELLAQAGASLNPKGVDDILAKHSTGTAEKTDNKTGMTQDQLNDHNNRLRKNILIDKYLEYKGLLNPTVDEQTLRNFYDNNRRSFSESKSVKARHILIGLPKKPTQEQEHEAHDKASKILAAVKQGKDFELLAIQESDCSSKNDGGNLGYIKQGFMPKEFDAVAFALKPGETSGIVKTRYGFHIIRIEDSKPETIKEFNDVSQYITGYLQGDIKRNKVNKEVEELKKKATIEIFIN